MRGNVENNDFFLLKLEQDLLRVDFDFDWLYVIVPIWFFKKQKFKKI